MLLRMGHGDTAKYTLNLRLPEELAERIKEQAGQEYRSMNSLITLAVSEYLERAEKKPISD